MRTLFRQLSESGDSSNPGLGLFLPWVVRGPEGGSMRIFKERDGRVVRSWEKIATGAWEYSVFVGWAPPTFLN
jgi:hypothetical protein